MEQGWGSAALEQDLLPGFADLWDRENWDKIAIKLLEALFAAQGCWERFPEVKTAVFANSLCFSGTTTPKKPERNKLQTPQEKLEWSQDMGLELFNPFRAAFPFPGEVWDVLQVQSCEENVTPAVYSLNCY